MFRKSKFSGRKVLMPSLKLIGAKTTMRALLYELFPPHEVYIEPFAGSTTVLVGKERSPVEIIGDTNEYLANYIHILQNNPKSFYCLFKFELKKLHKGGRERFVEIRDKVTQVTFTVEKAVLFYLITKTCMNGIWRLRKRDGMCNSSYCKQTNARGWFTDDWFNAVVERYQGVVFVNASYKTTIARAAQYKPELKFLFLDPPYRFKKKDNGAGTVTTYNGQIFTDQDFIELKEELDKFEGKWLMTVNDDEWTRDLFKDYEIIRHEALYSCSRSGTKGRGKHPEMLVSNYPITTNFCLANAKLPPPKVKKSRIKVDEEKTPTTAG